MITSQPTSLLAQNIKIVNSSYIMSAMPSLSKFCGQALSILVENRPSYGWIAIAKMMRKLENLTNQVESHWSRSLLASLSEKTSIGTYSCFCAHASQHRLINCYLAPNSRETMTTLWNVLKTLLFTTIMILQSILPALLFVPYPSGSRADVHGASSIDGATPASPFDLALMALHVLSHLSFVMPQFGGVTSTAEGGLPELKKAFYMALDVLSESASRSDLFVHQLCDSFKLEGMSILLCCIFGALIVL